MTELKKAATAYANIIAQSENRKSYCKEDFIAGAQWQSKQSPWISVEERLLETDDDLYIALDTKMNPPGCDVCEFNPQTKAWTDNKGHAVHPTHWHEIFKIK